MVYAKIPAINGIPQTEHLIIAAVSLSDTVVAACINTDIVDPNWEEITEDEWKVINPVVEAPGLPDHRDAKIAQLEENQRIMQETINFLLGI